MKAFALSGLLSAATFLATNGPGFVADETVGLPFEYIVIPLILPIRLGEKKEKKADE